jgi:predicted CXXCH cytochrome family protein
VPSRRSRRSIAGWLVAGAAIIGVAVAWVGWRSNPAPGPLTGHEPTFVGSTACAGCHAGAFAAWRGSQHALAMQPANAKTALGDFAEAKSVHGGVESTFFERDGRLMVRTDGADGKLADFEAKYTFGIEPLQQYLVELPGGRLQALSLAWDSRSAAQGGARWFHLYDGDAVDHRDELHWTRRAQNWNFMCADCHSTDVRKRYDVATDRYSTTWAEISVGCEACHGPASNHVAWAAAKGPDPSMGLTVALDERRSARWPIDAASGHATRNHARPSDTEIEVCAGCHARRAQIAEGWRAGAHFLDHYRPALLEPPLYHPDGQQRDEVYIWGSFLQSRMYRQGVTCGDCHEPHGAKLRAAGNVLCAQCHLATRYDTVAHHHHAGSAAGTQCVDCHMPPTTYMRIDPRKDHSLRIPRPDLTVSIGTPNACTTCHADRSAQWAADATRRWYGHDPQGFQQYATTFAAAARGDPQALPALDTLSADASQPGIARATALAFLARSTSPEAIEAGRRAAGDADALVRHASIDALASLPPDARWNALAPLLGDPLRVVRIDAASALADAPAAASNPAWQRAAAEFEATQHYLADRPEARMALGTFYARQRRTADAEAQFRSAIALDASFVPTYVNFADFYRAQRRDVDAERLLRDGIDHVPESGTLQHALGLTLVRLGRKDEALQSLQRATVLAPDDARFAYVYAVGLHSSGRPALAIAELKRVLKRHPGDRDLVGALAAMQRDAGLRGSTRSSEGVVTSPE